MKLNNILGLVIANLTRDPHLVMEPPVIEFSYRFFHTVVRVAGHVITTLQHGSGCLQNKHLNDSEDGQYSPYHYRLAQKLAMDSTTMVPPLRSGHDNLSSRCRVGGLYREYGKQLYGNVGITGHQANGTLMTGNPLLNETLRGGFRRGELPIIVAPTTAGRSQLRVNIASYMDELRLRKLMFTLASKYEYTAEGMLSTSHKHYYT